jgi:hypothetical protein
MPQTNEALRRVVRQELRVRQEAVSSSDARAVAAAAVAAYEQLADRVAPIIGRDGVNAIYTRSLHLLQNDFPWLPSAAPADTDRAPAEELRATLEGQDPSVIAQAMEALVLNFADLLATLIGDRLAMRLFRDAWPDAFGAEPGQEGSK